MNPKIKTHLYAILVLGVLSIYLDYIGLKWGFTIGKPLTTLLIIALPLRFPNKELKRYTRTITIGLLFCLIGDVFLLEEAYFIFGLIAFLIGHLFFTAAFVNQQGFKWPLLPGVVLILIALVVIGLCYSNLNSLFFPVLLYISVIICMSWQGIALQARRLNFRYLGWAVSFFLFSDALIAINKFYTPLAFAGVLILGTYWLAISLLALSATKLI